MADLKTNTVNAWESTLSSSLAAGATTINVTDTTGSPAVPFYVTIDPGNDAKREVVLVDSAKTSTTFTLSAASSRGQDGTSDVAHDSDATIAIVPVAAMFNDTHDRVDANNALITSGEAPGHTHNAAYEAKVSRTGATAGEVPILQADNTLAFGAVSGTSEGFRAYRSTSQALSAAVFTTIIFDTEVRDEGADYDPTTGEWTVPATGWYDVAGSVFFASLAAGERYDIAVYVNGANNSQTTKYSGTANLAVDFIAVPLYLTAGDVVTLRAQRGNSGNVTGAANTTFFTAKRRY